MDLSEIKNKIQASSLLSDSEKKEWIFLLPKMSEEQQQELVRILSIKMEAPQKPKPDIQKPEIQKPPMTPHPSPTAAHPFPKTYPSVIDGTGSASIPSKMGTKVEREFTKPPIIPLTSPLMRGERGGSQAETPGLTIQDMRQARSLYEFFDSLAARWTVAVKNRQKSPEEITQTFETSPLYKAYVEAGKQMLEGRDPIQITKSEFEAIADFRTSLKKILQTAT